MELTEVASNFRLSGKIIDIKPLGNGHINRTYLVTCEGAKYSLQAINTYVFKNVDILMDNMLGVTEHISSKRTAQKLVPLLDGGYLARINGDTYRLTTFAEGRCIDTVTSPRDMYLSGLGFGQFQMDLADYDASKLHDTIKDFHNTPQRYENFERAYAQASEERRERARMLAEEYLKRKNLCFLAVDLLNGNKIPYRVTHNDTKINNIVFNEDLTAPVCVIDLDTVMKGSVLYDFGDAIRAGGSYAKEDELDLSKVLLDEELFRSFCEGFLKKTKNVLNHYEIDSLAESALLMTYECGMRFLTDYLQGDVYFKIGYEMQNYQRAAAQMALLKDMEIKLAHLKQIVREACRD